MSQASKNFEKETRRSKTTAFKRAAILHFEQTLSKRKTAQNLKIPRSALVKWIKNKEKIFDRDQRISSRRIWTSDSAKKPQEKENEERLFEWITQKKANKLDCRALRSSKKCSP
ncbi:unnamed protein product [Brachionus calyciflorus]|uniref:HTH psq-type domain-containing protein n=1 Tax=Brachionus calyciflorus TaxID=104777 RepID=A0A814KBL2_9BILA|nr:unnamed protein product [Brachionus calyciflorus]